MAKTNKNSTKNALIAKEAALRECYLSLNSWRESKPSETYLEKLSLDIMDWSNQEDALRLKDFCRPRGLEDETIKKWAKIYPQFGVAYQYALDGIASRRENGLIFKGWPAATIHYKMGQYDRGWRREQVFKAVLLVKVQELLAKNKKDYEGLSTEDLSNCVTKLIEQAWGEAEKTDK